MFQSVPVQVLGKELAESRVKQAAPEQGCPNRESVYRQHPTLWNKTEKAFTIIILDQVPL